MLLDTSVLVEIDRGIEQQKMEHLISLTPHGVSSASVMEISTVFFRSVEKAIKLDEFVSPSTMIPIDQKVARKSGKIVAGLIDDGERIDELDVVAWKEA